MRPSYYTGSSVPDFQKAPHHKQHHKNCALTGTYKSKAKTGYLSAALKWDNLKISFSDNETFKTDAVYTAHTILMCTGEQLSNEMLLHIRVYHQAKMYKHNSPISVKSLLVFNFTDLDFQKYCKVTEVLAWLKKMGMQIPLGIIRATLQILEGSY